MAKNMPLQFGCLQTAFLVAFVHVGIRCDIREAVKRSAAEISAGVIIATEARRCTFVGLTVASSDLRDPHSGRAADSNRCFVTTAKVLRQVTGVEICVEP